MNYSWIVSQPRLRCNDNFHLWTVATICTQAHLEMLGSEQFVFQVDEIEVVMPNQHYITIDMTKMGLQNKDEVSRVVEALNESAHTNDSLTDIISHTGSSPPG